MNTPTRPASAEDDRPIEVPDLRSPRVPTFLESFDLEAISVREALDMRAAYLSEHPERRTVYDEKEDTES